MMIARCRGSCVTRVPALVATRGIQFGLVVVVVLISAQQLVGSANNTATQQRHLLQRNSAGSWLPTHKIARQVSAARAFVVMRTYVLQQVLSPRR